MTEHIDLSSSKPNIVESMNNTLNELIKGYYRNNDTGIVQSCPKGVDMPCQCWMGVNRYNYFLGIKIINKSILIILDININIGIIIFFLMIMWKF